MPVMDKEATQPLAWDTFVDPRDRPHVLRYREHEWPRVRTELARRFNWHMTVDPCWGYAGAVVFWKPVQVNGESSWRSTEPKQVSNAAQFAYWLRKGFRLRPPSPDVEAEVFQIVESALPPEEVIKPPKYTFPCDRHGASHYEFHDWDGYLQHCDRFHEAPEHDPPRYVAKQLGKFPYACVAHNLGFINYAQAHRHWKEELRKGGKSNHLSPSQMEQGKKKETE